MLSRRIAITLVVLILLANASASCLFSGQGPMTGSLPGGQGRWHPVLAFIADQLTLPIPTAGISDVRDSIVPFFSGLVLLIVAWMYVVNRARSTASAQNCSSQSTPPSYAWRFVFASAIVIIGWSLISATSNHSWQYSWGWCVRTAAGLAISLLICQFFDRGMVRQAMLGIVALAVICCVLGLAHRISRGLAYPTWPIGPITITAGMTATWSVIAFVLGIYQLHQRGRLRASLLIAAALLGLIVLIQTGRRSALAAWLAALFLTSCLHLVRGWTMRRVGIALAAALGLAACAGLFFLSNQAASPTPEVSGPVALRLTYWKHSAELIRDRWLLGYGPDTFILHMTNKVAPLRAESPDLFRSNIDPYCHNEWLQAIVELGLVGGLAYLVLPIGLLVILIRRMLLTKDKSNFGQMMACSAGLVTIMVAEAASITLRGPIMPILYWTLLGLAGACARQQQANAVGTGRNTTLKSAGLTLAAIGFFVGSAIDVVGSVEETFLSATRTMSKPRLFAEKYISSRITAARLALDAANANPQPAEVDRALKCWQTLYDDFQGYAPVHAALAECLVILKQTERAAEVLNRAVREGTNPYDPKVNELLAELSEGQAMEQYHCARRSLRGGALGSKLQQAARNAVAIPAVNAQFDADLQRARSIAANPDETAVREALVDTLRLSALRAPQWSLPTDAIQDQRLAAFLYRDLEKRRSAYRRPSEAEVDAFLQLSRLLYELNSFRESLDAIKAAERYAVLGIRHETLAHPKSEYGYVIGEVMPTEFPENLRPLWRFSALLHLIVGDDRFLDYRIYFSLPPQRWRQQDLSAEMAMLAREAYEALSRLPADERPRHCARLLEMSRGQ